MRPVGIAAAAIAVGSTLGIAVPGAASTPPGARGSLALGTGNSLPGPGLWRLDLPTRQLTRLTRRRIDNSPAWSRDGRRIAFVRGTGTARSRLFVVNRDGSGLHQAGKLPVFSASWGPGDREIAVSTAKSIWIVAPNGSIQRRLYSPKETAIYEVAWSPDGQTILFDNDAKGIFAIGAHGGRARLIIRAPRTRRRHFYMVLAPAWAPNGRHIAFIQKDLDTMATSGVTLRTASPDGSAQHTVTRITPGGIEDVPTWSPDSRWIAFADWRGRNQGVFEVPAGGGKPRLLYGGNSGTFWSQPAWSPRPPGA
jgi:Tol biopolymer transport system component